MIAGLIFGFLIGVIVGVAMEEFIENEGQARARRKSNTKEAIPRL